MKPVAYKLEKFVVDIIKEGTINSRQAVLLMYFLNSALKKFPLDMTCNILHHLVGLLKNENCKNELATHIYTTIEVKYGIF